MKAYKIILMILAICPLVSCSMTSRKAQPKNVNIRVTAYHARESDHLKYKTLSACGKPLVKGKNIAADWSVFPLGTQLKFNNHVYEVSDYGSALVKKPDQIPTVDLYVANRKEMKSWGVRFINNVEVISWGSYEKSLQILQDRRKYWHCRAMYDRIQAKL